MVHPTITPRYGCIQLPTDLATGGFPKTVSPP